MLEYNLMYTYCMSSSSSLNNSILTCILLHIYCIYCSTLRVGPCSHRSVSVSQCCEWLWGARPAVLLALLSSSDSPITLVRKRWTPPVKEQLIVCLDVWGEQTLVRSDYAPAIDSPYRACSLPMPFIRFSWSCRKWWQKGGKTDGRRDRWRDLGKKSVKKWKEKNEQQEWDRE